MKTLRLALGFAFASLAPLAAAAPSISTQPVSLDVAVGQSATFSVGLANTTGVTYRWQRNGVDIPGQTAATFSIPSASRTDADYYDVVVTDGTGSTMSSLVRLTVAPSPYPAAVAPNPAWKVMTEFVGGTGNAIAPLAANAPVAPGGYYVGGTFTTVNGSSQTMLLRATSAGVLDPNFMPPVLDNAVLALALQPQPNAVGDKIIAGGSFLRVNGTLGRSFLVRLNSDGTIDPSFNVTLNGSVLAIVTQTDGKLIIGGNFTSVNGTGQNRIARLTADGALDNSFAIGTGFGSTVNALALDANGDLVVGGSFTSYNGTITGVNRLARLKTGANVGGTLDSTLVLGSGFDGTVNSLAIQATDGAILVGGGFSNYGTTSGNTAFRIARLSSTGTLDATFATNVGTSIGATVSAIALQYSGTAPNQTITGILLGGNFSTSGNVHANFTRLSSAGVPDSTLATPALNNSVSALALQANGQVLIGGSFNNIGGSANPRTTIARLNNDATLTLDTSAIILTRSANNSVGAILPLANGKVLVAGGFLFVRGQAVPNNIARFNGDGTLDPTFNFSGSVKSLLVTNPGSGYTTAPTVTLSAPPAGGTQATATATVLGGFVTTISVSGGSGYTTPPTVTITGGGGSGAAASANIGQVGANNTISAAALLPDGRIAITGFFTAYNGITRNRVAILNADGSLDTSFNSGGIVTSIAVTNGGANYTSAPTVSFSGGGGSGAAATAVLTGTTVTAINITNPGNAYTSAPTVSFTGGGGSGATATASFGNTGLPSQGQAIAILPAAKPGSAGGNGNRIFVGGAFTSLNGNSGYNRVAIFNADGSLDSTFVPSGGADNTVNAVVAQADGNLIIGGSFGNYNGTPRADIARIKQDGTLDSSGFIATGVAFNGQVNALGLAAGPAGQVIAAGTFTTFNGATINNTARLSSAGVLDTGFPAASTGGTSGVIVQEDGGVIVRAGFLSVSNGAGTTAIARLGSNGTRDANFVAAGFSATGTGFSPMAMLDDGRIFTANNGTGLALTQAATAPTINSPPTNQTASVGGTATFTVGATNAAPLNYQWFFNGIAIPGATGPSYTVTNAQLANVGSYTVTVSSEASTAAGVGTVTSSPVTLSGPNPLPTINNQPQNTAAVAGQPTSLTVNVTTTGTPAFQWRRGGLPIAGATSATYALTSASRTDADVYDVVINDGLSVRVSQPARLSVAPNPYPQAMQLGSMAPVIEATGGANTINKILLLGSGKYYAVGDFRTVSTTVSGTTTSQTIGRIARFNANGGLDSTFAPTVVGSSALLAAGVQSIGANAGKVLVGGGISVIANGTDTRRLVRLNSDGSLDTQFNLNEGSGITGGQINAVVVQPNDDKIIVAGTFTFFNGLARNRLLRLNADGTLDLPFYADVSGTINCVTLQNDGKILIGGAFLSVNGQPRTRVARLNADGTLDNTFNPVVSGVAPAGADNTVRAIAVVTDSTNSNNNGKIVIGGSFLNYNGNAASHLVRVTSTGAFDATYGTFNGNVNDLACQADGSIIAGGSFSTVNGSSTASGTVSGVATTISVRDLVRITSAGAIDLTFNVGNSTGLNGAVNTVALNPNDGSVLAGGLFTSINGTTHATLARFGSTGAVDANVNPTITTYVPPSALAVTPRIGGGKQVLIAGSFTAVNGTPRFSLARLNLANDNTNGSLDTAFNTGTTSSASFVGGINGLVVRSDGKIVVVGGFNQFAGTAANRIARLNPVDGSLDSTFVSGTGFNNVPTFVLAQPDGRLLVGGGNTTFTYNGVTRNGLVRLFPDGALDPSFVPPAFNNSINAAALQPDGNIVVVGSFSTIGTATVNNVARLNGTDGTLDLNFSVGAGPTSGSNLSAPSAVAVQANGQILIGGDFTSVAGVARTRIARLNNGVAGSADGSVDLGFNPSDGGPSSTVNGFLLQEDGKILIRGLFSSTGNNVPNSFTAIRYAADGTRDTSFIAEGLGNANGLALLDDGTLLAIGANFANFSDMRWGLAQFVPGVAISPVAITLNPAGTVVADGVALDAGTNLTLTASFNSSTATPPVTFQWWKEGNKIAGATNATLQLNNLQLTDAGGYSVDVANVFGTVSPTNSALVFLKVNSKPVFGNGAVSQSVDPQGSVILGFDTNAYPEGDTYQWYRNNVAIPGAIGPIYTVTNAGAGDAGTYHLVDTNAKGSTTSPDIVITLSGKPLITAQPASANVALGGAATLNVTATGTGTLTYQWRKNNVPITGATNASLALSGVTANDAAIYDVVVSNAAGSTVSATASVTIDSAFLDEAFAAPLFSTVNAGTFMAVLNDGSIVQSNNTQNGTLVSRRSAAVVRYLANGTRDFAFEANLPTDVTNGTAITSTTDGKFYVSLADQRYNGAPATARLARFFNNGTLDTAFTPYRYERPGTGTGEMRNILPLTDGSGKILAAGFFQNLNGTGRSGLVRFNSDGSLDSTFGVVAMTLSGSSSGVWTRPIIDANGKILITGDFASINGISLPGVARLNPDGTNDTSFVPWGFTRNSAIRGVMIQSTGKIVLAGRFTVAGLSNIPFIRLNTDGGIDMTFSMAPLPFRDGNPAIIRHLAPLPNNGFVAVDYSVYVCDANGSLVASSAFASPQFENVFNGTPPGSSTAEAFFVVPTKSDGTPATAADTPAGYVVAGVFDLVNGLSRPSLVKLDATGVPQAFTADVFGAQVMPFTFALTNNYHVLAAVSSSQTPNGLADLNPDGSVATTPFSSVFADVSAVSSVYSLPDGRVFALVTNAVTGAAELRRTLADGTPDASLTNVAAPTLPYVFDRALVLADGRSYLWVNSADPQAIVNGSETLLRLNASGAIDTSFTPVLTGAAATVTRANGSTGALTSAESLGLEPLAVDGSGRVYVRYRAANNLVRLARLLNTGAQDSTFATVTVPEIITGRGTFNATITDPQNTAAGASSLTFTSPRRREFLDLVIQSDGKLVVGGQFAAITVNGTATNANGLVRLNSDGTVDSTFAIGTAAQWTGISSSATDLVPAIEAIAQQPDGRLLLVGSFDTFNGVSAAGIVRLNAGGANDASYVAPVTRRFGSTTWPEMQLQNDGSILLMGPYAVGGERFSRGLVRLFTGVLPTFATQPQGASVVLGGNVTFTSAVSGPGPFAYQWYKDSVAIANATSNNLALTNLGAANAGNYTVVVKSPAGTVTSNIATLTVTSAATIATQPTPAFITPVGSTVNVPVVVNGLPTPTFTWRQDGNVVASQTSATLNIANAQSSNSGVYALTAQNSTGTVTTKPAIVSVVPVGNDTFPNFALRNPNPTAGSLKSVAFGNATFVAVGTGGRIFTSTNGTTWTQAATVVSSSLNAVAYSAAKNLFVAVGNSGDVYTAADTALATWTKRNTASGDSLNGVAVVTNGATTTFTAVGFNGRTGTSSDGVTWTFQNLSGNTPQFNGVAAGLNGSTTTLVGVGSNGAIWTSTNGTTWAATTAPTGLTTQTFINARFLNNQFVIVGNSGTVITGNGGGTWTQVTTSSGLHLRDVALVGTTYVLTADNGDMLKSTSLSGFTLVDLPTYTTHYGLASNGTDTFAAVSSGGEIWASTDTAGTWARRNGVIGGFWKLSAVEFLNNKFIAVGSQGTIYASADGDTWIQGTNSSTAWLDSAAFGAGLYVLPNDSGNILTSSDALTWTTQTTGDATDNNGVAFDGTRFVVVGVSGKIRTSTNGTTWSNVTVSGLTATLRGVAARTGLFVAVGDSGTIYTSPDGATWTSRPSGTTNRLWRVRNFDGTFVAVGEGKTVLVSGDGINWVSSPIATSGFSTYRDIARLTDGFYVVSDGGQVLKSLDLATSSTVANVAASELLAGIAQGAGKAVIVGEGGVILKSTLSSASATPVFAVNPGNVTTDATKNIVLSALANSSGPLTYQWQKDGANLTNGGNISGVTSPVLVISGAVVGNTGGYRLIATNTATGTSTNSNTATVTVNALATPVIQSLPIVAQASTGQFTFTVAATGTAPLTYQWYKGLRGDTSTPVGSNSATFTTTALTGTPAINGVANSDRYWVRITNFAGQTLDSATTTAVALVPRNGNLVGGSIVGFAASNTAVVGVSGAAIVRTTNGTTWTRVAPLSGSSIRAVAYGNSRFVAVGDSGNVRVSTDDGVTWTTQTAITGTPNLNGVCFDGTQFVAVTGSGTVLTSTTGVSTSTSQGWTTASTLTAATTPVLRSIACVNVTGLGYVVVGDSGVVYTSDLIYGGTAPTWTSRASNTTNQLLSVAPNADGTKLVAIGVSGTIRLSVDKGATWTTQTSTTTNSLNQVAFGNGVFLIAGSGPNITSTDGVTWSAAVSALPTNNAGTNAAFYNSGRFFIGGGFGEIFSTTSSTAAAGTWTLDTGITSTGFNDVIFAGGAFVGVGNSGLIMRSADGVAPTAVVPATFGTASWRRVTWGKGFYAAVGDSGITGFSTDGVTWTSRTSTTFGLTAATFGASKFVAAGSSGGFATSTDGLNWTTGAGTIGTANITGLTFGVVNATNVFVAVNNAGGIFTSPDAVTWTARTSGVATALNNVAFLNGKFYAVGANSVMLTSADGNSWSAVTLPTTGINLMGVAYGDGMYLATHNTSGNSQLLFASLDGVNWNATTSSGNLLNQGNATTVAFGNGAFLFVNNGSQISATLPAADALRITTEPVALQSVANGATATVSVVAAGTGLTYQWYDGASGDTTTPINGATTASYTTPALVQSKRLWVRVTTTGGAVDSATAQLNGAPTIVSAPVSRMVNDGTPVTFQVSAYGAGTLSYQWKFNGSAITGATGAVYALNPATLANAGNYSVTVTNTQGSATSSTSTLSVTPVGPTLGPIASTFGRNIPVGANTEFSVPIVAGTTPLTYQWKYNGAAITGATKSTYFISNATLGHTGTYTVTVSNPQGTATSTNFAFVVSPELGWRWRNPLPTGNSISSVRFVNGLFYVGATRSTILTSADAATWTQRAVPGTGNIFGQAYGTDLGGVTGNNLFVALGGLDSIFTSPDGVIWTARDSKITDSSQLASIAFGAGRFVASGSAGHTTTSTDGVTWTAGQIPTAVTADTTAYVRFVNNKFYVATHDFDTNTVNPSVRYWTSTNGLDWVAATYTLPTNEFLGDIALGGSTYVGLGRTTFLTSTDGLTWVGATSGVPANFDFNHIRYVNGRFVAIGAGGVAVSVDGANWSSTNPLPGANLVDVDFGNGVYVIAGNGVSGSVPNALLTSTDAVNWTQAVAGPAQIITLNGITTGNGKYAVVGNNGTLVVSNDGLTWTTPTTNPAGPNNLLDSAYGNGLFVAVGAAGRIMTAPDTDLNTWTNRTVGTTANLRNIKFANGRFFAVGDSGVTVRSTDGITWTVNPSIAGFPQLFGTAFGAGVQVATGNSGGIFSSSDDGATWALRSSGLTFTTGYSDVIFANNRFVVVGLGGIAATSTDGINWTQVPSFTSEDLGGLAFVGGSYIAPGTGTTYYVSADGVNWLPRYSGSSSRVRDYVVSGTGASTTIIGVGNNGAILAAGVPVILSSPPNTTARAGSTVTLTSLVGGSPLPVTYQWMKDGAAVTGGTSPTLTLTNLTTANGGVYTLVATNTLGSASSTPATLTVSLAPTITTQPQSIAVTATQSATFTAAATGTPTPTFQWKKNGVDVTNGTVNGTTFAGATTATLTLTNVQPAAGDIYTVVATNNLGSDTSQPATLTVNVLPAVTTPPANLAVVAGNSATFSVVATGTPAPTYQWRVNGLNVSGATNSSVTLTNIPLSSNGSLVTVALTNTAGTVVSSAATLTVNPIAPVIVSPLSVTGVINTGFSYLIGINATTATFAATNLPAGLSLNTSSGVISGTPTASGTFNVGLTASNVTGSDTGKTLVITINPPPPVITSGLTVNGTANQALSYTIVATNSPTSYSASTLPAGLTRTNNVISGTPTAAGSTVVTVTASNATGTASRDVTFNIAAPLNAPAYGGAVPPSGTQNVAFSFTPSFTNSVNATNGYAITSGALPAGVTLNVNTGVISGTPTGVGTFAFTLSATGPGGTTSVNLSITVNPPATAPVIKSPSTVSATVNVPFTFSLTTDVAASSFAATGLPAGLSINATSGVISGTPTAPGTFNVQVSAANGSGNGPTAVLIITVNPSPSAPVISSAPVVQGRVGDPLTYQLEASNGPESFAVTSGPALSTFLTTTNPSILDATTGLISATPTATGTFKVWFAASNTAGGAGSSLEITFTILPALNVPAITSNGTAGGQVGQPFNYAITATNSPTSFGATNLPSWLTRTGGQLSGIPTTATTTPINITVTATNADGSSAPKTVAISIAPAPATPVITSALTVAAQVGQTFSYTITASDSPTSFSAGGLPQGLALNATTGAITGTPTQAGPFSVTLSAANAAGVGNNSTLAIAIAPAPQAPAITSAASVTGKVGVAFSYAITASNGPITSYAVNGTLPLGLALNTSTGTITGNPAAPGLSVVDLRATSANGTSQPQTLIIVINPADNVPVITSAIFAAAAVGVNFTYTITATNMPDSTPYAPPVTLEAVNLPPGLAVNPATGVIQGQPSTAGVFTASLVGTNAAGDGPIRSLTIFVQPAATAPVVTSTTTAAGQVGVAFSYQILATNSPVSFDVLGAPAWMSINGQSGALGGIPTAPGTFTAQLTASNSAGTSNPATLALYIAPAAGTPVITSSRSVAGQIGAQLSYTITASNTPTSFVAVGLPAGLSLNSTTGVISGSPTASGTFNVTVSASNANGAGQPATVVITIDPSFQISVQ